jgi:hypothetical protein
VVVAEAAILLLELEVMEVLVVAVVAVAQLQT